MYLIAAVLGWLLGSLAKIPVYYLTDPKYAKENGPIKIFFNTGGMPSGHSATVVALSTYTLLADGLWSVTFAIAAIFAVVVMTDAVNVRRATGENGLAIQKILLSLKQKNIAVPHYARGHTPTEVAAGGVIGVLAGLIVWLI